MLTSTEERVIYKLKNNMPIDNEVIFIRNNYSKTAMLNLVDVVEKEVGKEEALELYGKLGLDDYWF